MLTGLNDRSGTSGIGLCTVVYLSLLGATVYDCAPDTERERAGVQDALSRIKNHTFKKYAPGPVYFHELDLVSVKTAKASAESLKAKLTRLDILVANAATVSSSSTLNADGFDKTFAVNCLGHFVFVNALVSAVKDSANAHGSARITITASNGYKALSKLDYDAFTTPMETKGSALSLMSKSLLRYINSKLGVLYFAMELDRRMREEGVENVFVNAVHPGQAGKTGLGNWDHAFISPSGAEIFKRFVFLGFLISHSTEDAAKTQTFVSATKRVEEEGIHGVLWVPKYSLWPTPWTWMAYTGSVQEELKPHGADREEWKKYWEYCEEAIRKAETVKP